MHCQTRSPSPMTVIYKLKSSKHQSKFRKIIKETAQPRVCRLNMELTADDWITEWPIHKWRWTHFPFQLHLWGLWKEKTAGWWWFLLLLTLNQCICIHGGVIISQQLIGEKEWIFQHSWEEALSIWKDKSIKVIVFSHWINLADLSKLLPKQIKTKKQSQPQQICGKKVEQNHTWPSIKDYHV